MTNHADADITLEWAPFRIKAGVTHDQVLAASRALQDDFLARQSGFLRRELMRGSDGGYVDLLWWASHAAAQTAMAVVASSQACARYFALMDGDAESGAGVLHLARVAHYGD